MKNRIRSDFFNHDTVTLAKNLLGTYLVHKSGEGTTIGRIVETEAYLSDDPACHASRGMTPRNRVMFGPPGHAYIYFIYGMYYCFNIVTGPEGKGEAVLIRALEPVEGIDLMEKRRLEFSKHKKRNFQKHELCNGPGKLVIAMGIPKNANGVSLFYKPLYLLPAHSFRGIVPPQKKHIHTTTRIGIREAAHLPLRFYLKENHHVSRK